MKAIKFFFLLFLGSLFTACDDDNINLTTTEETPFEPTVVEVENALNYLLTGSTNGTATSTAASAYKIPVPVLEGAYYLVASDDVAVDCDSNGSFSASFDGGELFYVAFYSDEQVTNVQYADFEAVVDGDTLTLSSVILPDDCPSVPLEVSYEEADGRLTGTVTGEFFYFTSDWVLPFENCVNYISAGILEASFDVAIVDCN